VTATFTAGNHALTAVATDNGGLSTTSAVVNIAVKLASVRLTARLAGNAIDLSWPVAAGHLQAQTTILGATWSDVPNSAGTNYLIIPIDPANPSVFYRLTVP
jgi:hypothetical protein